MISSPELIKYSISAASGYGLVTETSYFLAVILHLKQIRETPSKKIDNFARAKNPVISCYLSELQSKHMICTKKWSTESSQGYFVAYSGNFLKFEK